MVTFSNVTKILHFLGNILNKSITRENIKMGDIKGFLDAFGKYDRGARIIVESIDFHPFSVDIIVRNAHALAKTKNILRDYFGGLEVTIESIGQSHTLRVRISRITIPNHYHLLDLISFLENNKEKGLFLGIGSFGDVYFPYENLTHVAVFGKTGFGKSNFFKFLLSQTLAFRDDIVNYIIDPKGVDFKHFIKHPRVGVVASEKEAWVKLFIALSEEYDYRKEVFSTAFTTPPSHLDGYKALKEKYKRDDLPEFKRMIIWIDETATFTDHNREYEFENNFFDAMTRKARAFGMHLIFSSQSPDDLYNINTNLSAFFAFYTKPPHSSHQYYENFSEYNIPHRGRLNLLYDSKLTHLQVPFLEEDEALAFAYGYSPKPLENRGFSLKEHENELDEAYAMSVLLGTMPKRYSYSDEKSITISKEYYKKEKTAPSKPAHNKIVCTDNSPDIKALKKSFSVAKRKSKEDFSWLQKDLRENTGLIELFRYLNKSISSLHPLTLSDIALEAYLMKRLESYKDEVIQALSKGQKAPLLIIMGERGLGKHSIAEALFSTLDIPYRKFEERDLALISDDIPYEELYAFSEEKSIGETQECEAIYFPFNSQALLHQKHSSSSKITVLIENLLEDEEKTDYSHLKEPHVTLYITKRMYTQHDVATKLLLSLLKIHGFDPKKGTPSSKTFARAGIEITPRSLDALIARAKKRAEFSEVSFDKEILDALIQIEKEENLRQENDLITIIDPKKSLNDLIVQEETKNQIQAIIHKIKHLDAFSYNFVEKLRKAGRVVSIFSGVPGTGKSMCAEVIAYECQLPLWYCDISSIINPFAGMTERNLTKIFLGAEASGALLLLDEADSFLNDRQVEIQGLEKRWTNHLLNLLESFKGIVIFTTNFIEGLDGAVSRRTDFKVIFKAPSKEMQITILKSLLEPDAPLEKGINYEALFEDISLSGGLIRNAVERAVNKMGVGVESVLTQTILRESLFEIYNENALIDEEVKSIGF